MYVIDVYIDVFWFMFVLYVRMGLFMWNVKYELFLEMKVEKRIYVIFKKENIYIYGKNNKCICNERGGFVKMILILVFWV